MDMHYFIANLMQAATPTCYSQVRARVLTVYRYIAVIFQVGKQISIVSSSSLAQQQWPLTTEETSLIVSGIHSDFTIDRKTLLQAV